MNTRYRFFYLLVLWMFAGNAFAQGTINAGSANYVLTASHFDITPEVNLTGAGTGDQLFEAGWWFRVQGDTQETVFPAPSTQSYTSPTATISWTNVATRNFAATKTHTIASAGAGSAEVVTAMQVTNNAATTVTLHLFHFIDFDVNGSAGTDSAVAVSSNQIRITDATAGTCEYRAPGSVAYMVRAFSATTDVAALLSDTTVTNFDNSGLPFGPGDFTGGFQYTFTLAPGASATAQVHAACNQPATPVALSGFTID